MKRLLCFLMCFFLLCGQVYAAEGDSLQDRLEEFMQENDLNDGNFSMSYYNLSTGESYAFNDKEFLPVGSVWTLPLHMHYYEQEALGAFDPPPERPDDVYMIGDLTLEDCRYHSIVRSDEEVSLKMLAELGTLAQYQQLVNEEFGHIDENALPEAYLTSLCYSAEFLMNCLQELTAHPETFRTLSRNYGLVQTGSGFAAYGRPYALMHILGEEDGMLCDVGTVSAPQPYLLVCFLSADGGEVLLAQLNNLLCHYVEDAAGTSAPTETVQAPVRSDSDFAVTGVNPTDHSVVIRWIGIALGAAAGLTLVISLAVWFVGQRREEDESFDD